MAKEKDSDKKIAIPESEADKKKALELALKQIDKAFGKGTLLRLGDKEVEAIESIPTGSLGLDLALGIGGVPKGRIIEIYGPESSGKTTLTLHIIAEAQKSWRNLCICRCRARTRCKIRFKFRRKYRQSLRLTA